MYVKDYITVDCADYGTFLPGLPDIITAGANIKMESSYVSPKALEKGSILRVTLPPGFYPAQDKDVRLAGFVKVESPVSVRIGIPNNLVIKIEFLEVLPAVSAVKISYNTDYRGEKPIATPVSYRDPVEMYADIKLPGAENYFRIFEHKYVIKPGKPFRISICLPSIVYEGETFDLTASIRDKCDNIAEDFTGEAALSGDRRVLDFPEKVVFTAGDRGSRTMRKSCRFIDKVIPDTDDEILLVDPKGYEMLPRPKETANCQRISANSEGLAGCSNPVCLRSKSEPRLYWGEFHVHTRELSDGMGTVGDAFHYMKNVSRFDFGGISDHSYLGDGHQFLPECRKRHISKDEWKRLLEVCREQSEGSSFIAVPGYEWTGRGPSYNPELDENWKEREVSDKNVIFGDYDKDNPILYQRIQPLGSEATEVDRATTPEELYAKLGGSSFMCISHSTSSDSMGTDLKHIDDRYEPVVEIYSMHGANEYYGNPRPLYCIYREGFVRDALSMGKRL